MNQGLEEQMKAILKSSSTKRLGSDRESAELRLKRLGIEVPAPPEPFGVYAEALQTGNLVFLTGMLPKEGRSAKFVRRVGAELNVEEARGAARLAAMNALAVARQHLGSLDKVTRIVRLGVSVATSGANSPRSLTPRSRAVLCTASQAFR
jgi:enamine deaminase RidA (YjgF/YER057c/UK114 family)